LMNVSTISAILCQAWVMQVTANSVPAKEQIWNLLVTGGYRCGGICDRPGCSRLQ
jgi:hypothetical protein